MRRVFSMLSLILFLGSTFSPANASHQTTPVIRELPAGSMWVAWRVELTQVADWGMRIVGVAQQGETLAHAIWHAGEREPGSIMSAVMAGAAFRGEEPYLHVESNMTGAVAHHGRLHFDQRDLMASLAFYDDTPGRYWIVGAVITEGDFDGSFLLHGGDGVTVLEERTGEDVMFVHSDDFGGLANAQTYHPRPIAELPLDFYLSGTVAGHFALSTDSLLFGWFYRGSGAYNYYGPPSRSWERENDFFIGREPGDYSFAIHASVWSPFLLAAEVDLPESWYLAGVD